MYENILKQANLNDNEIAIYSLLLTEGALTASTVSEKTQIKRGNTYYLLDSLKKKDLIEEVKQEKKTLFRTTHPQHLDDYIEKQQKALDEARKTIRAALPALTSDYNLVNEKPGVFFLEGQDGLREALFDSLKAKSEILAFVDGRIVASYADELNKEYVKQRIKRGIKKKIIMTDTPHSRKIGAGLNTQYTEIKFLDVKKFPFELGVEIYNDTISYLTVKKDTSMAVLVNNPHIAEYHRSLFSFLWSNLPA